MRANTAARRMPLGLIALAAGSFGIGLTELVIAGLLQARAPDAQRPSRHPRPGNPSNPGWAYCSAPDSATALSGPVFPKNIMVSANSATCSF